MCVCVCVCECVCLVLLPHTKHTDKDMFPTELVKNRLNIRVHATMRCSTAAAPNRSFPATRPRRGKLYPAAPQEAIFK